MASNGFERGRAFGVVSGLGVLAMLVLLPPLPLPLALPTLLAPAEAQDAASLRLESICGRPREDRKEVGRAAGCGVIAGGRRSLAHSLATLSRSKWRSIGQTVTTKRVLLALVYRSLYLPQRSHNSPAPKSKQHRASATTHSKSICTLRVNTRPAKSHQIEPNDALQAANRAPVIPPASTSFP